MGRGVSMGSWAGQSVDHPVTSTQDVPGAGLSHHLRLAAISGEWAG